MPTTRLYNSNATKRERAGKGELVIKPSSIRIWIHEKDISKLWQVLLAGQGARLLREVSSHPKVRKFLEMVPYIINHIREIHSNAVENNMEDLRVNLAHPAPQSLIKAKDQNGLTIIHKAAGLGHYRMLQLLADTMSDCLNDKDGTGKTPLHWAASAKNSNLCYNLLVSAGSREDILDNNMKPPIYYKGKNHEINRSLLTILPEAPRVPDNKRTDWSVIVTEDDLIPIPFEENRQKQKSMQEFVSEIGGDENVAENNQHKNSIDNEADYKSPVKSEVGNGDRLNSEEKVESDGHEAEREADVPQEFSNANISHREDEQLTQSSIEEPDTDLETGSSVDNHECPQDTQQQEQQDNNKDFEESKKEEHPNDLGDNENSTRNHAHEEHNDDDQAQQEPEHHIPRSLSGWDIQGIVHGGPDFPLQSPAREIDREDVSQTQWIVDDGDMEKLAAIVLNGDGLKLIGAKAKHPDIQAFLDNVTVYMSKIRQVHLAARTGNLVDMQSALSRRKFATAKDEISPSGASPLHVAALFGHSNILRYLGGRFPETITAVDNDGRTALHYAATLNDNGSIYDLLLGLGANAGTLDKLGHSAEFYRYGQHPQDVLTHSLLMKRFTVEDVQGTETVGDQDIRQIKTDDLTFFRTEQGRYLANALGEPLVKGLTEVIEKRPEDAVNFLANFLQRLSKSGRASSINSTNGGSIHKKDINGDHDVVSISEESEADIGSQQRDEHGQSVLHFACARRHSKTALMNLIDDTNLDIAYRDELYRTPRDVSLQANQPENTKAIDQFVSNLAANGNVETLEHLVYSGYDHIVDVVDSEGRTIQDVAKSRGHEKVFNFLQKVSLFEVHREELHTAIRLGNDANVREMTSTHDGTRLVCAKNYYGSGKNNPAKLITVLSE